MMARGGREKMAAGCCRWWCRLLRVALVFGCCCRLPAIVDVDAFNLDTSVPLVKTGTRDSYFGFSLAQHYIFNGAKNFGDPV